jgi:beta-phosphoglucomutase-like phosphatase (HAD superfamily)
VPRGKPAPDLFLHAAARMSHDPARCVVVEDSTAGVQAGRAAGMRVLAFAGGGHVDGATYGVALRAAGAHTVFHAMAALPALLAAWEAGP